MVYEEEMPLAVQHKWSNSAVSLAYADDVDIIGRSFQDMEGAFLNLVRVIGKVGLQINAAKTKYLRSEEPADHPAHVNTWKIFSNISLPTLTVTKSNNNLYHVVNKVKDILHFVYDRVHSIS
uniref:Reverse transcriptase domain-containing protein n=1 Tax=Rhodnius prolixus TaxID=13249 RepID=T1HB57_RHOPR